MNPVISLLNNHDVEIRQKTLPGSIPRSDIANLLDAIARMIEKDVDYALGIPFDSMVSSMTGKQLTTNDKYFVSQVGSVPGGGCVLTLKGDGAHSPDLSNFLIVSGSYSNTVNVVNQLIFYYDGANYCVSVIQLPAGAVLNTTAGSSGPDTTPPVVASIAVLNANPSQVVITYNEGLKTTAIPAAGDFVITAGGSPATINSVAVSANTVLLNLASPIIAGSSNFIQYTPGTNKIQDLAGNLAAAIPVNTLITNNVGSTGGTGTQLAAPTLNAPTVVSSTELDETWSNVANASSYLLQRDTTSAFTAPATAYSGAALSDNDTGLSASTTYYYRVKAVGNGTTYTDSPWSNVVSATTGGIVLTNITWPTTSSTFTESPTGTFAAASGAYGLSALKIPLGTSGFVMMDFPNVNSETVVLGLDVQNALEYYALAAAPNNQNYDYAIYAYSGNVYKGTNGGQPVNVGTSAAGDKYRLNKVVSGANMTVTAERSTDGGTTWTILYTYAAQTDADLFIKCSFAAASKLLVNPKGNNIS